jgi:hypothetical protein
MTLFRPAEITSAYLKSGFLGFQGSGKTLTMSLLAMGLVLHMRKLGIDYANKPVFFLDTETGSDWVKPFFDEMGIELYVAKTRAFTDLIGAIDEATKEASFLLTDSVTHFWTELTESYGRAKAKKLNSSGPYRLQFQDWAYLKGEQGWRQFTDRYINSPLHMGVAGRAGFEYDYFEDDDGKKQLEKTGVKMKAEGEFGFEPSLLVQMEIQQHVQGKGVDKVWREAHVIKDRSTLIDGKTFTFTGEDDEGRKLSTRDLVLQVFRAFEPHIKRLNLGGKQLGVDTTRTSEHIVQVEKKDWHSTQKAIVLEEIEAVLVEHYPSTKQEDKLAKAALILKHFETRSWTEVENMRVDELRLRFDSLYTELKNEPSRYAHLFTAKATATEIDDEIPGLEAPATTTAPAEPQPLSLKDKLLTQLATLNTVQEILHFAVEAGQMAGLSDDDRREVGNAVLARQGEIAKQPKPEERPEGGEPDGGKKAANRKRSVHSTEDEPQAVLATS